MLRLQLLVVVFLVVSPALAQNAKATATRYFDDRCGFSKWPDYMPRYAAVLEGGTDKLKLQGVAMMIRHGERAPHELIGGSKVSCAPEGHNAQEFEVLKKTYQNMINEKFLEADPHYAKNKFTPIAEAGDCVAEQLTPDGALQLWYLGKVVKERYEKMFKTHKENDIQFVATHKNRTFQSAIAFAATFLYPLKDKIKDEKIFIKYVYGYSGCWYAECACKNYQKYLNDWNDLNELVFNVTSPDLREMQERYLEHPEFKNFKHPYQTTDVALGIYICRNRPLPCSSDTKKYCYTYDIIEQFVRQTKPMRHLAYKAQKKVITFEEIASMPFLKMLVDAATTVSTKDDESSVKIISGHDMTIMPMLAVLGLAYEDPPYASILSFELYRSERDSSPANPMDRILVRVLYNGVDVTSDMTVCEDHLVHNLCPMRVFLAVSERLDELTGGNLSEFCNTDPQKIAAIPKSLKVEDAESWIAKLYM